MFYRCFRVLALVVANSVVTVLGLLLSVVGVWMRDKGHVYYPIFDDQTEVSQLPVLLIVVGGLIFFVGIVGILGAVLSKTVGGRIVLGMYGFILAFLIICEIAGGITAAVSRKHFEAQVDESVNYSFSLYPNPNHSDIQAAWNQTQTDFKCCGYQNYSDYQAFYDGSVPESCCNKTAIKESNGLTCDVVTQNATIGNYSSYIYQQNCTQPLEKFFLRDYRTIAGIAVTFGILQITGVLISCVAVLPRKDSHDDFEPL